MTFSDTYINFDFFNIFYNSMLEDLLVVYFLYNFIKYVILCLINELIWPTHFFNRKHSNVYLTVKFRTYSEYINKCSSYTLEYYIFNYLLILNLLKYSKFNF